MEKTDKITESLTSADILFGLRPALETIGFDPTEEIFITFKYEDRRYRTGAIPPVLENRGTSLNTSHIGDAVMDWLNKAEIHQPYQQAVGKELGMPDQGEFEINFRISSKSMDLVLKRCRFCWPCFRGAGFCCVCR